MGIRRTMNLIFIFFSFNIRTSYCQLSNPLQGISCELANCGQGKCVASNASILGFDCECNSGWKKKLPIGPLTFPSCVVPNYTLNFECDKGALPKPPEPPPFNISDPCSLVWCGDGKCVVNGSGYNCQCNEGSTNLLGQEGLSCLKQCHFGADCSSIGFNLQPQPPPPPPPDASSASPRNDYSNNSVRAGSNEAPNYSRNVYAVIIPMLLATLAPRI